MTPEQWAKLDNKGMLPYITQMTIEKYVNGVADSLKWKDQVQKVGMDETYFANQRIDIMREKMNQDERFKQADLRLKEMEINLKANTDKDGNSKTPTYSDPVDVFKSTQTLTESWNQTVDLNNQFRKKVDPIITGSVNNLDNLNNPNWIKENGDNYEVSLWANYKAMYPDEAMKNDKPNIEGFKAFKSQVENGDFRNNPVLSGIQQRYKNESQVSEWLKKTTNEVANLVLSSSKIDQVKVDNGPSLGDYARQNGWNGTGEMTFGLPDGRGGYKQYTWTDLKNEYDKSKSSRSGEVGFSNSPNIGQGSFSTLSHQTSILPQIQFSSIKISQKRYCAYHAYTFGANGESLPIPDPDERF